jgi:two-component system sensor histidine kinase PhcS
MVRQMFLSRILSDVAQLPCFIALFTTWGRSHVMLLSKYPPLAPCVSICWMIYASEGVMSPYYAGINLVLVGVCLLIPYTLAEAASISGFVLVCYSVACFGHRMWPLAPSAHPISASSGSRSFLNNVYFLIATALICVAACRYATLRRLEEFRLRFELDVNNRQLATTLDKLQETEVQLVQSEKMNALGKLSAGLLHEINNPLNFTFMALQLAQQDCKDQPQMTETLNDIGEGMNRIKTVISDLRAFAYPTHHLDRAEFSISEALTSAMRLTAHELGHITVDRGCIKDQRALGSATQIAHVFMNVLVNAAHALKTAGRDRDGMITVSCADTDGKIRIAFRDNGCGVAPENLPKLLDPFFTTKAPGEGMGLGLSICHTIIKNHGGTIAVASELGQWTEVSFELPAPIAARSAA